MATKTAKPTKAQMAMEAFERWFNRDGHWIYRSREHALETWRERGIGGLPACPEVAP